MWKLIDVKMFDFPVATDWLLTTEIRYHIRMKILLWKVVMNHEREFESDGGP